MEAKVKDLARTVTSLKSELAEVNERVEQEKLANTQHADDWKGQVLQVF